MFPLEIYLETMERSGVSQSLVLWHVVQFFMDFNYTVQCTAAKTNTSSDKAAYSDGGFV